VVRLFTGAVGLNFDFPVLSFQVPRDVIVYRLEVGALEMNVVHESRIRAAKERLGESEQAATTKGSYFRGEAARARSTTL
jgi:hypothetical protein